MSYESVASTSDSKLTSKEKIEVKPPPEPLPQEPKPIENRQLLLPLPPKDGNFVLYDLQRIEVVETQFMKSYTFPRRVGRIVNGYRKMEQDLKELNNRKPKPLPNMPRERPMPQWKYKLKIPDTTAHDIGWLSGRPECSLELFGLDKSYNTRNLNYYQLGYYYTQQH